MGRLWQYNRKVKHDGFRNRCNIEKDGNAITLASLTPQQVYEDQMKMRGKEGRKSKKKQKESSRENYNVAKCEKNIAKPQERKERKSE